MKPVIKATLLAYFVLAPVWNSVSFEIAYRTTLYNQTGCTIEVAPDLIDSKARYTIPRGKSVTFAGGFSTERFAIKSGDDALYYRFPLTEHFARDYAGRKSGRRDYVYALLPDFRIYLADTSGSVLQQQPKGFPIAPGR
jgi:hypothetical protein